ncbi:MAG TPA: hypothetical protein VLJ58_04025 [Ramlibacter sp.]|nr:hypothetical protein [Ramlibacter sp.]
MQLDSLQKEYEQACAATRAAFDAYDQSTLRGQPRARAEREGALMNFRRAHARQLALEHLLLLAASAGCIAEA